MRRTTPVRFECKVCTFQSQILLNKYFETRYNLFYIYPKIQNTRMLNIISTFLYNAKIGTSLLQVISGLEVLLVLHHFITYTVKYGRVTNNALAQRLSQNGHGAFKRQGRSAHVQNRYTLLVNQFSPIVA
jgi:hypothetical protein